MQFEMQKKATASVTYTKLMFWEVDKILQRLILQIWPSTYKDALWKNSRSQSKLTGSNYKRSRVTDSVKTREKTYSRHPEASKDDREGDKFQCTEW